MYMMKLDPEQVSELYFRRENLKEYGIRKPISMQAREAIADYIAKNKKEKSHLSRTQRAFKNNSILQSQK